MANHSTTTSPLQLVAPSTHSRTLANRRQRGIAAVRVMFGLIWGVAAWLKWQPAFQNSFLDQVSGARDGQPALVQGWISFWVGLIGANPLLFARIEATTESAIALCLIFGLFSNLTYIVGILLSLGIWSTAEGFGGPYVAGQSTDVGTALPYAVIFAILLAVAAGRYYSMDSWLSPKLGRLRFLATSSTR